MLSGKAVHALPETLVWFAPPSHAKPMPMKLRLLNLCVAALLWSAAHTNAGWVEKHGDKAVIHLKIHDWIFPDPAATDAASQADTAVIRAFTKRFPELIAPRLKDDTYSRAEVRLHEFSGITVEGVESDLLAIAGRVAPDVIYVNFRRSDTYIRQGILYPLDRPEDGYFPSMQPEEAEFRVFEKFWPVIRRKGPDGSPHVWALPYGGALGKVLLYRKDLFDAAGVAYPDANWTWDDMLAACRKLTDPAKGVYGIRFARAKHESWFWINFLWSAGGEAMTYDEEKDTWHIAFDSPEGVRALDFYTRLCTEPWTDATGRKRRGYAHKEAGEARVKWDRGQIAMMLDYMDEKLFSTINPDVTGMAPVPKGPTGQRGAELNGRMMGIFSEIEDPLVRDAAWEFIKFYDSKEAAEIRTRVMVEGGFGRFMNPKYLELFGYPEIMRLTPPGWADTFRIVIESGKPEPYGRNSNVAYDLMTEPIHKAEQMALNDEPLSDEVLHGLLSDAANKARRIMLNEQTPQALAFQRRTALLFLLVVVPLFVMVIRRALAAFRQPDTGSDPVTVLSRARRYKWAIILLLPAALSILMWQYFPLLRGALMAFQDYRLLGESVWTGLDNFGAVLWSSEWWTSVWNALRYSILVIALTFLPPLLLAILLQEVPFGTLLFRTLFYLPAVMSGLVVILLWKSFYEGSEAGLMNRVLLHVPAWTYLAAAGVFVAIAWAFVDRLLRHGFRFQAGLAALAGIALGWTFIKLALPMLGNSALPWFQRLGSTMPEPIRWLGDPETAMFACVLPLVWAGVGPGSLIYLAALKGISDELYEAADMDGASFTDKILFIVIPMLKPLLVINFVGAFIHAWFHAEANILAMTGGASGTEVAGLHIFYRAFIYLQFGPATAMAWILAFMLIGFTVYQLRILSRIEFRAAGDKL